MHIVPQLFRFDRFKVISHLEGPVLEGPEPPQTRTTRTSLVEFMSQCVSVFAFNTKHKNEAWARVDVTFMSVPLFVWPICWLLEHLQPLLTPGVNEFGPNCQESSVLGNVLLSQRQTVNELLTITWLKRPCHETGLIFTPTWTKTWFLG